MIGYIPVFDRVIASSTFTVPAWAVYPPLLPPPFQHMTIPGFTFRARSSTRETAVSVLDQVAPTGSIVNIGGVSLLKFATENLYVYDGSLDKLVSRLPIRNDGELVSLVPLFI